MRTLLTQLFLFIVPVLFKAQCPVINCPASISLTQCVVGETITAVSNYSANISSRWIAPGNIPIASIGTDSSVVYLNNPGTYTVEFKDNSSNCVVIDTVAVVSGIQGKPYCVINANSYSVCSGSPISLDFGGSQAGPGSPGAIAYTITYPPIPNITTTMAPLSGSASYSINFCGNITGYVQNLASSCISSYDVSISCSTLTPAPITFAGTNTVCAGSSTSYTWTNGLHTGTANVKPAGNSSYPVSAIDVNGCISHGTFVVAVNPNCSQVWPGDANSDGVVDNTDALEIGLAFSNTGPPRSGGSNMYVSQYAANWTGTVSSGKNMCHADCNGDGIVNFTDTIAIFNNFQLLHAFRQDVAFAEEAEVWLDSPDTLLKKGRWSSVAVMSGSSMKPINQVYGMAFDLNFDPSLIETGSVYLVFNNSFLDAGSQNVIFRKPLFNAGKLYAATVRTDKINVNGNGQIAELFFRIKNDVPDNSILGLSVSNAIRINSAASTSSLTGGQLQLPVDNIPVSLSENETFQRAVGFYPNPANGSLVLYSGSGKEIDYTVIDLSGRVILNGHYSAAKTLDLSTLEAGIYLVKLSDQRQTVCRRLVLVK